MGYYRLNPDGSPIWMHPLEQSRLSTEMGIWNGSECQEAAPWHNPPYFTGGQLEDGTIPETARVLVVDSDEYGGVNHNQAIDSPAIELQGSSRCGSITIPSLPAIRSKRRQAGIVLDDGPGSHWFCLTTGHMEMIRRMPDPIPLP